MRRLAAITALALVFSASRLRAEGAPSVLADEVVATVETKAILLSELELEARLSRALDEGAGTLEMDFSESELRDALERLVDRLVVFAEAERLQVFTLGPGDVDAAVKALRERLGRESFDRFLSKYGVDERTLSDVVGRDLRVERYLDGRFRLAARAREADAVTYFALHAGEFPGRSYDQAAPEIRARLSREKFRQLAQAFVKEVRKRARVRILRDFEAPGSATPRSGTVSAAEAARPAGGEQR